MLEGVTAWVLEPETSFQQCLLETALLMTAAIENVAETRICASTERVRRHRERRRQGMCLITVEMPNAVIEGAIARGLLKPEASTEPWSVIESAYASLLSDAAIDRLVNNGVIARDHVREAAAILRAISKWLDSGR